MAKTREIKGRIKAVANIQRITKTMQMISTARFQTALRAATDSQPYTRKIAELVGELAGSCAAMDGAVSHPLLRTDSRSGRRLLLVLTSNRGLCGGYNANILRNAVAAMNETASAPAPGGAPAPGSAGGTDNGLDLEVVGKKGIAYFRFIGAAVSATYTEFGDKPTFEQVEELAEQYMQKFTGGRYDAVSVVYMSYQSIARQTPSVLRLLPLSNLADKEGEDTGRSRVEVTYEFSPGPQQLLAELLPASVKAQLFQCFNEAVLGEQIARMVAMKNATDAAGKMGKELNRKFNRARQAAITTELSEIIGGASALQ